MLRAFWWILLLPFLAVGSTLNPPQPDVAFSREPDYPLTKDVNDRLQLFDGATVLGTMWLSKASVGWVSGARPIEISIRLRQSAWVGGVCLHGARNSAAQVSFAERVDVFTSVNGTNFLWAGEIRPANAGDGVYVAKWFCADMPPRQINRLKLAIMAVGDYFFIDEIRLMPVKADPGPAADEIDPIAQETTAYFLRQRKALELSLVDALADLRELRGAGNSVGALADLVEAMRRGAAGRSFDELDGIERGAGQAIARTSGRSGDLLVVERSAPFGPIGYFSASNQPNRPIQLMSGSHRAAALNLRNFGAKDIAVRVGVQLEGAIDHLRAVPFVTGYVLADEGVIVGDPLLPLLKNEIDIPAGQVRQLWIDLGAGDQACGTAVLHVQVASPGIETKFIDVVIEQIAVRQNALPDTTVWGYLSDRPVIRFPAAAAADMRDHGVTTAVLPRGSLPWPLGRGHAAFPYRALDADLDALHGYRHYLFYMGLEPGTLPLFGGREPAFSIKWGERFRAWLSDWVDHLHERGLSNADFALYPVDEPGDAAAVQTIVATAKLAKKVDHSLRFFVTIRNPALLTEALIDAVDIFDLTGPALRAQTISQLRNAGKRVMSYSAEGGGKLADPGDFYRRQGWQAFALGLSGFGFWSYSDAGLSGNVWDDTDGQRKDPAIIYDAASGLVSSRRWEAWRDGLQDYRLLSAAMAAVRTPAKRIDIRLLALRGLDAARDETQIDGVRSNLISRLPKIPCAVPIKHRDINR